MYMIINPIFLGVKVARSFHVHKNLTQKQFLTVFLLFCHRMVRHYRKKVNVNRLRYTPR